MDAEDELNISWTSSEDEDPANEADVSSTNKDSEKPTISKDWFKKVNESERIVPKFFDIPYTKCTMKYPITSWEYDSNRQVFTLMRQKGHYQFMDSLKKFKRLPR